MSSSDDARPARRPQPDRDSFYDKHARTPEPAVVNDIDDDVPATTVINTSDDDALPTVQIQQPDDDETTETPAVRSGATRTDVRNDSDTVVTEPFVDVDDETADEAASAQKRRAAEHLTEEPLPYIEPQPTARLDWEDEPPVPEAGTAYAAAPVEPVDEPDRDRDDEADVEPVGRGTADLGLLILRVVVGIVFVMHGLQKLTTWTWLDGFGIDGFAAFLANTAPGADPNLGFDPDVTRTLALLGGLTETIGGAFLILGLITPIAGSAVLGVILVAGAYKMTLAGGVWFFTAQGGGGIEYELVLAAAAVALILCGPGTYSFDRQWGWSRRPAWGSAAWLIIAIAAAVAVWVVFNGSNPLLVGA